MPGKVRVIPANTNEPMKHVVINKLNSLLLTLQSIKINTHKNYDKYRMPKIA